MRLLTKLVRVVKF